MFDFFQSILSIFSRDTPEKILLRQQKALIKELRNTRPPVLEKKVEAISPAFVQMIYDAWIALSPVLALAKREITEKQGVSLRRVLVESITTEEQKAGLKVLEEPELGRKTQEMQRKEFYTLMEEVIRDYLGAYREDEKRRVNLLYNRVQLLAKMAEHDYPLFFRDFDPAFNPSPTYTPAFQAKEAKYFAPDFKAIQAHFNSIVFDESLAEDVAEFCRLYDRPPPDERQLLSGFKKLEALKARRSVELLVHAITGDFNFRGDRFDFDDSVVAGVVDELIREKKDAVEKAYGSARENHLKALNDRLFGGEFYPPLKYYTPRTADDLANDGAPAYRFTREMDLIKAFLILKFNKSLKEYLHGVILKARFKDPTAQKQINEAYHLLSGLMDEINRIDELVADEGKVGHRIKTARMVMRRDSRSLGTIGEAVDQVDEEVKQLVAKTILCVKDLGTVFKNLHDSYHSQNTGLMANILDFDGSRTEMTVEKMNQYSEDFNLFLNTMRSLSQ